MTKPPETDQPQEETPSSSEQTTNFILPKRFLDVIDRLKECGFECDGEQTLYFLGNKDKPFDNIVVQWLFEYLDSTMLQVVYHITIIHYGLVVPNVQHIVYYEDHSNLDFEDPYTSISGVHHIQKKTIGEITRLPISQNHQGAPMALYQCIVHLF